MDHISLILHVMQDALELHAVATVTIGTFLLGENAALAAFALSAQGYINPVLAVLCVFIGSMLADIFWFFMTEYVIRRYYEERFEKRLVKAEQKDDEKRFIITLIDKHFFWVLIFIKFLMGMRLLLTIYIVLKNRIPFHKKVILDAIGTVLFLGILFPVGWFFGKGVSSALAVEQGFISFLSIIVFIMLFGAFSHRIVMFFLKRYFRSKK